MNTLNGYSKSTLTDTNVLTAAGGHIPLELLKANSAKILDNYFSTRPTTCDHLFGDGGLRSFKATSSMTTSKPPYDAHVLHFAWDKNSKWESQLALSTSSNPRLFIRSLNGTNWSSWATLLGTNNYTEYVYSKTESDNKYLPKLRMTNPDPSHASIGAIPFILALKAAGSPLYTDPEFAAKNASGNYTNNSVSVYNISGGGTVTITNIEDNQNSANSSGRILQISTTTGTASPGRGGFYQNMQSRAGAVFVQIFRAKIPEGYYLLNAENSMGKDYKTYWMTERVGTGKWEWYCRVTICGMEKATNSQGLLVDFSSGGHVYLERNTSTIPLNVTWYLSYCNTFDLTKGNYDGLRTKYSDTADTVDGQHFNWNNNKNDHTYLWAASANGQAYLVHRASMSVNYANSAGSATSANSLSSWDVASSADTKRYIWMSHSDNSGKACYDADLTYLTSTDTLLTKNIKAVGDLKVGNNANNHTLSLQGSSSLLKLFAWGDATYIESGNSDFSANQVLKITGIGGNTGSDLYLNFSNIYCRAGNYTNIDSGNLSVSGGGSTWGSSLSVTINGTTKTLTIPSNPNTDTKNTAGSTNTSSKIFLIGATSQAANPQTYSHDTAYVGTDGCLYSNSTKVSVDGHNHYHIAVSDTRSVNNGPYNSAYNLGAVSWHLKQNSTIGVTGESIYSGMLMLSPWGDSSGGAEHHLAFGTNGGIYHRYGASTMSTWSKLAYKSDIPTKTSQLTNDSGFITSRGYLGTTAIQASSAAQAVAGITTLNMSNTLTITGGGMKVTGAAYFGGGTTYYFGPTGNVHCSTLTAASTTILKGSFLLWNSTNSYISFYNNGKTSSNLVALIHGMAGYNTTSATYTSGTNIYFRIFSSAFNGTTISTAGYYDYIFPNVPQGLTARTVHTIFTTQQSSYTLNGTGGATGDVSLTFWRGSNASWLLLNTGGNLRFKYNYYNGKANDTYKDALVLNYDTGKVCSPTGFYEESDERLKDFYNDVEVDLEKLTQLPKKYFRWKRDPLELNIGTSAQEVQKLYPELVTQNDEGILSVAYDKLSIIALKGIDLLYKEIKELKVRIELLENK